MSQRDLEKLNAKLRGATVEEIVQDGDGLCISFRGDTPDLFLGAQNNEVEATFDGSQPAQGKPPWWDDEKREPYEEAHGL